MTAKFNKRKITSISKINQTTIWISLEGRINGEPGQFVMVWLPNIGEKPFSIAQFNPLGLMVVNVGPFSHAVHQLNVGDSVWIKGPLGRGFTIDGERLLLVGGGYGSAPLLPLAIEARANQKKVNVFIGAKSKNDLLLLTAFQDLGCEVTVTTEDGTSGEKGLVTSIVEKKLSKDEYDNLYACGPIRLLSALAKICIAQKVNYQLSWEANMRCGMGLCGSCEVPQSFDSHLPPGWLACFDGPVFVKRWGD